MEELSYENILDLIKMKEKIDKVITSIYNKIKTKNGKEISYHFQDVCN